MKQAFTWGVSTSSYQIEGANQADGRSPCIWDHFCRQPFVIIDGSDGSVACDHYHRYQTDVNLIAELGVSAYRFSTAWPRIIPNGTGKVNSRGLDFYERLVDALLAKAIDPWVCLYHWDLPQALQERGGWANRDMQYWFTDYAMTVCEKLHDRVKHIALINEHNVIAWLGHLMGVCAPGLKNEPLSFKVAHHLNLTQGYALATLRHEFPDLQLGTIVSLSRTKARRDTPEDQLAADYLDLLWNDCFLDPVFHGHYPKALTEFIAPYIQQHDMAMIKQPLDFLGVNYYTTSYAQQPDKPGSQFMGQLTSMCLPPPNVKLTDMCWEIDASGFYDLLMRLKNKYDNPTVFITENGAAFADNHLNNGTIQDQDRIDFYQSYINAMQHARRDGANIQGFFAWTLLDNFEWGQGYSKYFGLVHIDRATMKRTPKASYYWLQNLVDQAK